MRHRKSGRRLGRNSSHRKAMFRNMATSLLEHGQIKTTDAKAKELRKVVDRLITLSKRVTPSDLEAASGAEEAALLQKRLHAVRQARKTVKDRDILQKLFAEYSEQFSDRPGGYTRITKIGRRDGDNAPMSVIELVTEPCEPKSKSKKPAPEVEAAPEAEEAVEAAPEAEEAVEAAPEAEEAAPEAEEAAPEAEEAVEAAPEAEEAAPADEPAEEASEEPEAAPESTEEEAGDEPASSEPEETEEEEPEEA